MTEDNAKAAFLILEAAEQGRPTEFVAQFLASYILSGELNTEEALSFMADVLQRTCDLLHVPTAIWDGLLPGGPGPDLPFMIVDKRHLLNFIDGLNQDEAVAVAEHLVGQPNIGTREELRKPEWHKNIVLTYPVAIYQKPVFSDHSETVWYANKGCEWFADEMGEIWVKFVPQNGLDHGREHMLMKENVSHIVRRND